jgi:glyoxylase-like metal-dependent hydrolase (beta-lactamase superfamily II)
MGANMYNWFTIEQIDDSTYAISEYKHWEETHCYLLNGDTYSLLIDTGLGVGNIKEVVDKLTKLPIKVATTHVHWDHIGGHKYFNDISVHETEKEWLTTQFPIPLSVVKANLTKEPCDFPDDFNIQEYRVFQGEPSTILQDGDEINLGNRTIKVIHTPGHSPGHVCFYEIEREYLYSGDLIYAGTLDAFYPTTNPYEFMKSVRQVKQLRIQKILPAHHQLHIPVELIHEIDKGFTELYEAENLKQGSGIFHFINYNIHI